jgi:hypothetical protein
VHIVTRMDTGRASREKMGLWVGSKYGRNLIL